MPLIEIVANVIIALLSVSASLLSYKAQKYASESKETVKNLSLEIVELKSSLSAVQNTQTNINISLNKAIAEQERIADKIDATRAERITREIEEIQRQMDSMSAKLREVSDSSTEVYVFNGTTHSRQKKVSIPKESLDDTPQLI